MKGKGRSEQDVGIRDVGSATQGAGRRERDVGGGT